MASTFATHQFVSSRLGDLVQPVWSLAYGLGDELAGVIAPDGQVEFVFQTGTPCCLASAAAGSRSTPSAMIFALRLGTLRLVGSGENLLVAFRVSPAVASVILGRSLVDYWDRPVALRDLIGPEADELLEQIASAPRRRMSEIVEGWLLTRLRDWGAEDERNLAIQRSLFEHVSHQRLEALADEFGFTGRTLRRHCERYAGLSPKQLVMTGRMLRACGLLWHRPDVPIVEISSRLGFSDQAAFANAFRHYVGTTPARLRAEPLVFCEAP